MHTNTQSFYNSSEDSFLFGKFSFKKDIQFCINDI